MWFDIFERTRIFNVPSQTLKLQCGVLLKRWEIKYPADGSRTTKLQFINHKPIMEPDLNYKHIPPKLQRAEALLWAIIKLLILK